MTKPSSVLSKYLTALSLPGWGFLSGSSNSAKLVLLLTMKGAASSPLLSLFGSGNRHIHTAASSSPALIIVKETPLQSAKPLVDHLISCAGPRDERTFLLSSGERRFNGKCSLTNVLDFTIEDEDYGSVGPSDGQACLTRLLYAVQSAPPSQPLTVVIDALDSLLDRCVEISSDPCRSVYRQLQRLFSSLNGFSRLVMLSSAPCKSSAQPELESKLLDMIYSPNFSAKDQSKNGSSSPLFQIVQIQPPAIWRHLLAHYGTGLRPASTTAKTAERLLEIAREAVDTNYAARATSQVPRRDAFATLRTEDPESKLDPNPSLVQIFDWDAQQRQTDPRLWLVAGNLTSLALIGGQHSWFELHKDELEGEEIEAVRLVDVNDEVGRFWDPIEARITLSDLLGPTTFSTPRNAMHRRRLGWGIITSQHRLLGGKFGEEILGCVVRPFSDRHAADGARMVLVPLDMGDRRSAGQPFSGGTQAQPRAGDESFASHPSLIESLPFNLLLSDEQKRRRKDVHLPFSATDRIYEGLSLQERDEDDQIRLRRGTTGQSTIYFEPDSADEEDEEDPDDL